MAGRPEAPGPYTLARHAADVVDLLDGVEGPVVLVGQSLGAQVAELAAAARPDRVVALALLTPIPLAGTTLPREAIAPFRALGGDADGQREVRRQLAVAFPGDELDRLCAAGKSTTPTAVAETADAWNDGDPAGTRTSPVTAPVLVVRGGGDPFITADVVAEGVVPRFAEVSVATVDGAGHWPHVEQPDAVATLIDGLVARATADTTADDTADGVAEQGWTTAFAQGSAPAFTDTFAPDVVLRASVLRRPVEGRDAVAAVMAAASGIYTSLVFTHEARNGRRTYLEWEATLHDGTPVSGVTRLEADDDGRTVDVAIHHRPLDGALSFSAELGRRLVDRIDPDTFHRP
ncbi:alpha/beta fold hydrolase [Actinomycetospora sp. TBRC 11914]|nr:alpha/beta fold hydrolase [Actinomycetospora sp. TBRC 11914]